VKVEATDDDGQMQTWSVEWGGGAQLTQEHVTRDSLKPGDRVIVTGSPGGILPNTEFDCTRSFVLKTDGSGKE
jgi:thiamine monophosphate kinase